jgi:hypothetical protein
VRLITAAASSRDSSFARIVTIPLLVWTSKLRVRSWDWSAIFDLTEEVMIASVVRAVGCNEPRRLAGSTTINPDSNRSSVPPWSRREKSAAVVSASAANFSRRLELGTTSRLEVCVILWRLYDGCAVACAIEYPLVLRLYAQPQKQLRVVAPRTTMRISDLRMPGRKSHQELTLWT